MEKSKVRRVLLERDDLMAGVWGRRTTNVQCSFLQIRIKEFINSQALMPTVVSDGFKN
jgi:hypothetical protein